MKARSAFVAATMTILASSAWAADSVWTGAESTDWATAGNWENGTVPSLDHRGATFTKTDAVHYTVDFGSTQYTVAYTPINSGLDAAHTYIFKGTGEGGLTVSAYDTLSGAVDIGRDFNGSGGALFLESGKYTFEALNVGWWYTDGLITVSTNATLTVNGTISLGNDPGNTSTAHAIGTLTMDGGTLYPNGAFAVGNGYNSTSGIAPTGIVNQTSGIVYSTSYLGVGCNANDYGIYNLSGGTATFADCIVVGRGANSYGELNISGGYMESASGKELQIGEGAGSKAKVTVTGGALVNHEAWFCIGHNNGGTETYLEIDGGAVSNICETEDCNFTLSSWNNASSHAELQMKSGELYASKILYVGEYHNAKMVVTGGRVYAGSQLRIASGVGEGELATLVVKGGVIETPYVYKATYGALDIRGGTFKATAAQGNYFDNCGDMTLSHNGLGFDTAGFNVTIVNNLSGLGGITKKGAGTLTLSGTVSVTGAIVVEEGSLVLNGTTYGVGTVQEAAAKAAVVAATWTNSLEDGDQTDPANWTCYDAEGNIVAGGVPGAATAVTIPYNKVVATTDNPYQTYYPAFNAFTGYASVVLGVSGTAAPRGDCTVPAIVKDAIAWYDFDDMSTITTNVDGAITGIANKGTSKETLDAIYYANGDAVLSPYRPSEDFGERYVMWQTNSWGVASSEAAGISGDADRTLIVVYKRKGGTYPNVGENATGTMDEAFPLGIESEMWGDDRGGFQIEEQGSSLVMKYGNGFWENDSSGNPKYYSANLNWVTSPNTCNWQILGMMSASKTVSAFAYDAGGTLFNATSATSEGLGTSASAKIYVGTRYRYNGKSSGELGEAMVFDKALSEEELATVRSYLATKWLKSPEVPLDTLPTSIVFSGENAVYNLGGGDWTLANIAGAGTIADVDKLTVTGTITITVNDDGTIDPLVVNGDLDLSAATIVVKNARRLGATDYTAVISCNGTVTGTPRVSSDYGSVKVKIEDGAVGVSRRGGFVIVIQ